MTTPKLDSSTHHYSRGRLLQVLGVWFGIAAAIGNAIAAGIVRTPGDIAKGLPNPWLFLGVWVVGGLYALVSASSMASSARLFRAAAVEYNFSRRAIGEYAGFIVGWSDWLSTCGTAAAVAISHHQYSGHLFPIFAGPEKIKTLRRDYRRIRSLTVARHPLGQPRAVIDGCDKDPGIFDSCACLFVKGSSAHHAAVGINTTAPRRCRWLRVGHSPWR